MLRRLSSLATGRRSRWWVIGAWLALALGLAPLQSKLSERAADESETFLVRGSDSAEADRLLEERFSVGSEVVTTIVYELPAGARDTYLAGQEQAIAEDAQAICESDAIGDLEAVNFPGGVICDRHQDGGLDLTPQIPPPTTSEDGAVALTTVLTTDDDTTRVAENVEVIREIVPSPEGSPDTLRALVTGEGGVEADRARAVEGIDGTLMVITALLIVTILMAIYRSPVAAAVPLAVVAVAYLVAAGAIWGLVSAGATTISGQTTAILIVLMFGAGTDYCLLIVARYRDELRAGDPQTAMARAAERTAPAILAAGAIVAAAMALLGLADFNATREMGPMLAVGMAVIVLAGLTLLPAILAALGRRAFWPRDPAAEPPPAKSAPPGRWARLGALIARRPTAIAAGVTALLVLGALGNLGGRESLAFTEAFRDDPDSVRGARVIREHFPPGRAAPLDLVMDEVLSGEVIPALAELPGVASSNWSAASDPLRDPPGTDPGGGLVRGELVLELDPFGQAAADYVADVRAEIERLLAAAADLRDGGGGAQTAVLGGFAAENHDAAEAIAADTLLIVPLALALIFAILVALLRSVLAPLYLIGTVVLSFAFALGAGSLILTHVFDQPGSDPSLPVFAFVFLVGLGVDYNVFLFARIREERARGLDTRRAVLAGLERTGPVITSAGLILAGTFSALMALTFEALFQFGLVIALGLLADTFLVRALLVPAIAYRLGERNWWPAGTTPRGRPRSPDGILPAP